MDLKDILIKIMEKAQKKNDADYMEYVKRGYLGKTAKPLFVEIADELLSSNDIEITLLNNTKDKNTT